EILDKVYFKSGKATIRSRSFSLLDQVASVLKANLQVTKIQVEGHTDDRGSDTGNLALSQARAQSVLDYLVSKEIDPSRLIAIGYGEARPISSNSTKRGREANRRVRFVVLEINGKSILEDEDKAAEGEIKTEVESEAPAEKTEETPEN
ncbi:OmpA family protein, partial [Myxococcota bacterium]|nr:OmpA family protein [Myxococcota bacterium]